MMRFKAAIARCLGVIAISFTLPATALAEPLTLVAAQQRALTDNPRIAQIEARLRAAMSRPSQAGSLPDPTLNLGLLSVPTDTFDLDQEAMTQLQVGINQPLPWFGKLALAESIETRNALAVDAELAEARNQLIRQVVSNWWNLYYLDRSLEVVSENLQRLREFHNIAQSRYRVGKGLQQDALQVQLELANQLERQIALLGERRVATARLNLLLGRSSEQGVELPKGVLLELAELLPEAELIARAQQSRPLILRQQRLLEAANERRRLAERDRYPDLSLGASYGFRQDAPNGLERADLVSVTLGIKLPLYADRKQQRAITQREAEYDAQQQALADAQLSVEAETVQALADYRRAVEQMRLFSEGLLPQARQTVASMLSGYQVGSVDFSALIRAQLQVNRIQQQYWAALRDAKQAEASVNAAVGGRQHG